MNHYPKHLGDYLRKTLGLSMIQDGAYNRALDLYYADENPLPPKPEVYACLRCQNKADRDAVDHILRRYFIESQDGYRHERCDEELAKYADKSSKAASSASARWAKTHSDGNANASVTHSDGNANQEPITSNQKKEQKPARKRASSLPPDFAISDRVKTWADAKGFGLLDRHLEAFVGKVRAKGYTYIDWDEAFMNCIREDWGKVNSARPVVEKRASHSPAKLVEFGPRQDMPQHIGPLLAKFKASL